ncbi:hypothetical protein QUA38_00985 [Microcoleus sp. Pol12B4]
MVRSAEQSETAVTVRIGAYLQMAIAFQQRMLAVVGTTVREVKLLQFGILKLETIEEQSAIPESNMDRFEFQLAMLQKGAEELEKKIANFTR